MANAVISLFKPKTLNLINNAVKLSNVLPITGVQNVRSLYSKSTLGIDGFTMQQEKTRMQMHNISDKFREKMNEYSNEDSKSMIFTEDLKNMIHLSESDEDIQLVYNMIKKFNAQNKQVRFGNYVFGPVVMRMLHLYGKHDMAWELFNSPEMDGFFDQVMTYQILLDLLYENGKYDEVLKAVDIVKSRQLEGAKYPRNVVVLALAACYKLNTKESLDYAVKMWQELSEVGHLPMRRATTFAAGLALNQGQPAIALEILVSCRNQNYTTIRNIKVAAFADLGRVEDAIPVLKSILSDDNPGTTVHTFNKDVIEKVKNAVVQLDNPDTSLEFNRIEQMLQKQGHIADTVLDEQLCSEIQRPPMMNNRDRNQGQYQQRYQRNTQNRGKTFPYTQRPGLNDLV
ncbi:unnamed protein product [Brassicogethes aeneus]|uniref:Pentatricopeptide repeat-containing protein 2 n=1 Tax=Brassicogethes aeneus TaxID=1431903 RepID=A0A9P0AXD8_BRAAE|nr:unnamed protein product [Brassicogethes aeneus]